MWRKYIFHVSRQGLDGGNGSSGWGRGMRVGRRTRATTGRTGDRRVPDSRPWASAVGVSAGQNEEWQKVASQTAIFVEDRVRQWCGRPRGNNGQALVGKSLFATALANDAQYRLGKEPGEWEGWRALGTGFAQALSNVDRHNIQKRDDAKRYAFGVLGIGSLILTQLRYQHGEDLHVN
ncbi:TIGR02391 family protein [Streptomyces sp. NPDC005547]|uniref:TIGR02391 family protein n=1 Tax=Streptomyces sp. NPDC005547 TaxID=3154887 RepID=UPI0033AD8E03